MERRSFLALCGSTLGAGCASLGPSRNPSTPSPAPVPTDSPGRADPSPSVTPDDPTRPDQPWSLVEFETRPVTVSLVGTRARTQDGGELTMAFGRTATPDHPATIVGQFRNANDFSNTFRLDELALFRSVPSAWPGGRPRNEGFTYRDELVLAPTDAHELATATPELTLADDNRWRLAGEVDGPWLTERRRLEPGESVRFVYALVGRPGGEGFPRAQYHFEGHADASVTFDVWTTGQPGPNTDSGFEGADPAPLPEADRMAWTHADDATSAVYLAASAERVELPATIDFTLVNHSRSTVEGNPYFWRLWKHVDGQWFHVAPWGWPVPLVQVPPGGRHGYALAAFEDHAVECDGARSVGYLGGGRYAYEVGVGRTDATHAALLEFEAPSVTIEPTDGLTVTEDGATVHVEWPRRADEVPRATLTLTRTDTAGTRLIPEQVMQGRHRALRNTLPFLTGDVDRVVLVTDRNTVSRGAGTDGYDDGSFQFSLRDQAYEATAEFNEES